MCDLGISKISQGILRFTTIYQGKIRNSTVHDCLYLISQHRRFSLVLPDRAFLLAFPVLRYNG